MRNRRVIQAFTHAVVVATALTAAAACASAATHHSRVYVRVGPPAPIVETRVVAPGRGYVWIPGYHAWDGRAYVWRPGRWGRGPYASAHWVPARWVHDRRHGWYLVEGHWR